jgi:hypothetical protein
MASKRAVRRKTCEGKRAFSSFEEAEGVRRFQEYREGRSLAVYQCLFRPHYHIGHKDPHNEVPGGAKHVRASGRLRGSAVSD